MVVSIPRSGFCSFRPERKTWLIPTDIRFQSLVRDSAHSDLILMVKFFCHEEVSIPRSGFCSFRRLRRRCQGRACFVSIPRSGFCSFRPSPNLDGCVALSSFNPSFGILLIQTYRVALVLRAIPHVSIPRSGFCSFRPSPAWCRNGKVIPSFNPSFGILLIQTLKLRPLPFFFYSFNPSFGILLIQTELPALHGEILK